MDICSLSTPVLSLHVRSLVDGAHAWVADDARLQHSNFIPHRPFPISAPGMRSFSTSTWRTYHSSFPTVRSTHCAHVSLCRDEPIVLLTMPGTGLPVPYQLSDAKERAATNTQMPDGADKANQHRVERLLQLLGAFQASLPPPQELLDANTDLIQSTLAHLHMWPPSLTRVITELVHSEILVTESYWRKRVAYFRRQNQRARHELETVGFAVLKNLVHSLSPCSHFLVLISHTGSSYRSNTSPSCAATTDVSSRLWVVNQR